MRFLHRRFAPMTMRAVHHALLPLLRWNPTKNRKRTIALLLASTILTTLLGVVAQAGQGPSQWCSDNGNNSEIHILDSPVTFNLEPGTSSGNPNYLMICYSTTPYGSGDTEAAGGSMSVNTPTQNGASMGCWSEGAALVRLDCNNGVGINASNPTDPRANTNLGNGVNVAGNPVNAPSLGAGTDCNSGTVAISVYSCANGEYLGISGTGNSNGAVALSGTGWAGGTLLAAGAIGCSTSWYLSVNGGCSHANSNDINGIHVQGVGISGSGDSSGEALALSGTGCTGGSNPTTGISISGTNCAGGGLAGISGFGGSGGQVSGSGSGTTNGGPVSISAVGHANGGSVLNVSGGDKRVGILGIGVPLACDYGYTVGTGGYGCGYGGPASRPSQNCADNNGTEGPRIVHDPVTLDFETASGGYYAPRLCYSTSSYGTPNQIAGGSISVWPPGISGPGGVGCDPDPGTQISIVCNETTFFPSTDPQNTVAGSALFVQANAMGNSVTAPPVSFMAGTGCAWAGTTVAISTSSCAWGGILGASVLGSSSAGGYGYNGVYVPGVALSGLGDASATALAVSGTGCTGGNNPTTGISISGTNCAWGGLAGISALGNSGGAIGLSGANDSYGSTAVVSGTGNANGGQVAVSGTRCAYGTVAVGPLCSIPSSVGDPAGLVSVGTTPSDNPHALLLAVASGGSASSDCVSLASENRCPGTAISTTQNANGGLLGVSGIGNANSSANGIPVGGVALSGTGGASARALAASATGCTGGNDPTTGVSISGTNCAWGGLAGISGTGSTGGRFAASGAGCSTGWFVGIDATGCAYSTLLAVSGTGPATAYGNSSDLVLPNGYVIPNGFGVSGTDSGYGWLLGISGTGYASGVNAVSGTGNSYANTYEVYPGVPMSTSLSGTGSATGVIAVGGNGCSVGWYLGVNAQGCAYSTLLAISGTGPATAYGNSQNLVLPNGYVIPNGYGISGTGDAYGWLLGVSGTRNASGVNAVSGTGNSNANTYEIYPGIPIGSAASGGGNATASQVAVSGAGSASGGIVGISVCGGTIATLGQTHQPISEGSSTVDSVFDSVETAAEPLPGEDEVSAALDPTADAPLPEAEEVEGVGLSLVNSCMHATSSPPPIPSSATNQTEASNSNNGTPSCRNAHIRGDAGYVAFQRDPSTRAVAWGAYSYVTSEDFGWWYVEWFRNGKRAGRHAKYYPPHHTIPASIAQPGSILTVMGWHHSNTDRWYRVGGACRVPR
jgi:hypothetical protein